MPPGKSIRIGDHNIIREFTTIHMPTVREKTVIGSGCYMMANSHVAHDVIVHDDVTMANLATLSGHVEVFRHANLGFGTVVHPFCRIGAYAMIGMRSAITKDVPPFALINRQRFVGINEVGPRRAKVSEEDIRGIRDAYVSGTLPPAAPDGSRYGEEIAWFLAGSTTEREVYKPEISPSPPTGSA